MQRLIIIISSETQVDNLTTSFAPRVNAFFKSIMEMDLSDFKANYRKYTTDVGLIVSKEILKVFTVNILIILKTIISEKIRSAARIKSGRRYENRSGRNCNSC